MNEEMLYTAPELYLLAVSVEQGYANSLEDPEEKEELIW
jgi:hypothetical protein